MALLARCVDWFCNLCACAAQDECLLTQLIAGTYRRDRPDP